MSICASRERLGSEGYTFTITAGAAAELREFIEVNRLDSVHDSDEGISVFIRKDLDELNWNSAQIFYTVRVTVATWPPQWAM